MALDQSELRQAAARNVAGRQVTANHGQRTGFLSHSHKDRDLALGLQQKLRESGLDLYIDWQDATLPDDPNRETAQKIQAAIKRADVFLFLATQNSMSSRWCPWEIGYGDAAKHGDRITVVPTRDATGKFHGNEYLQLYRRVDRLASGHVYWLARNSQTAMPMQSL